MLHPPVMWWSRKQNNHSISAVLPRNGFAQTLARESADHVTEATAENRPRWVPDIIFSSFFTAVPYIFEIVIFVLLFELALIVF